MIPPAAPSAGAHACLHLLLGASADAVRDCLRHCAPGDSILLLDTAVVLLLDSGWARDLPDGVCLFVARPDVAARALPWEGQAQCVDDQEWAGLVSRHAHCLSWK
jgi:sulfur relay protein TusB/DsrH